MGKTDTKTRCYVDPNWLANKIAETVDVFFASFCLRKALRQTSQPHI